MALAVGLELLLKLVSADSSTDTRRAKEVEFVGFPANQALVCPSYSITVGLSEESDGVCLLGSSLVRVVR
jgi:hypothetical protein